MVLCINLFPWLTFLTWNINLAYMQMRFNGFLAATKDSTSPVLALILHYVVVICIRKKRCLVIRMACNLFNKSPGFVRGLLTKEATLRLALRSTSLERGMSL